jgi:hypothetical protein
MNRLTHFFIWLSRITHCRGFGVQSPTDYAFVRYVINEHWPYYKYAEVGQGDDWLTHRLGCLYFRLANWRQPENYLAPNCYQAYIEAGCQKARKVQKPEDRVGLAVVQAERDAKQLIAASDSELILVLDRLYRNRALWTEIVQNPKATVIFDLYYCGIVFFNPKRVKQHYIVNF